eukprot:TRINITY_DN37013_c0_g1_i1.p1 TRINITY_DN37013_c0_g1~~TRINITY_DN37013_c0_g1_i1.p1  ORF type:complete len:205 (-),score=17.35 TRINITY_DN37013_c0_g1_i1:362-976(-)
MNDSVESSDHLFKILLVGDSGVGKSAILLRFANDKFEEQMASTIGVDFKLKFMEVNGKKIKLTIWDTAGQERFRTLTSSYYRGAQGIIFVYDVCNKDSFSNLGNLWIREVNQYSTVPDAIKLVIGNKIDLEESRQVSKKEGQIFSRSNGCLFVETSAKANVAVGQAFEELIQKILETPSLVKHDLAPGLDLEHTDSTQTSSCSC